MQAFNEQHLKYWPPFIVCPVILISIILSSAPFWGGGEGHQQLHSHVRHPTRLANLAGQLLSYKV